MNSADDGGAATYPDVLPAVLRNYAFLADGERGCVVGPRGEIVWLCAPQWHSPPVFSDLVGGAGHYTVAPSDPWFVWGGYYEEASLIWRSRWVTSDGTVECREALALPGDPHRLVLLRRLEAVDRPAEARVELAPRADFGRAGLADVHRDQGVWTARSGDLSLRWTGADGARVERDRWLLDVRVEQGTQLDLVLEISDRTLPATPPDAAACWEATSSEWGRRVPELDQAVGARDAKHAYAVLSGLTSTSGGMVAAATTSLPERVQAGRDYDYRYCWIRDQSFAGQAVAAAGPQPLLDSAIGFISERLLDDGPRLTPAYAVDGSRVPPEDEVADAVGYPGGHVVVGNRIGEQFQLDGFGECLLLLAEGARYDRLDTEQWRAAEIAVEGIRTRGEEAGAGIWELEERRWAHSRLICAAGLRRMADEAPRRQAAEWSALADRLVSSASNDCLHPSGRWQRAPDDPRIDAALLLPGLRGAVPSTDPRHHATLQAVLDDLVEDDFVYRYRHDARPLPEAEGAFLLCGFLTALSLGQLGYATSARAFFERSRTACGPAGLFAEEYDVRQRQLRGNIPQAFVHALLFESSTRLSETTASTEMPHLARERRPSR